MVSWGFSGGVAAGRLGGAVPAATPDWGERRWPFGWFAGPPIGHAVFVDERSAPICGASIPFPNEEESVGQSAPTQQCRGHVV